MQPSVQVPLREFYQGLRTLVMVIYSLYLGLCLGAALFIVFLVGWMLWGAR